MIKQVLESRVPIKIWTDDVEEEAKTQLKNTASLPFVFKHVAVMPDVHWGIGATVGSVVATKGAVCPAAVGVDIGCGMVAMRLTGVNPGSFEGKLARLRHDIERSIPVGFSGNKEISQDVEDWDGWGQFRYLHKDVQSLKKKAESQIASLGGGNHFIEVCLDTTDRVWVVLHSGSRNIGKSIADVHIRKAKGLMKQMFIELPDPELAYFAMNTPEYNNYIHDMLWAQSYAKANRGFMINRVFMQMVKLFGDGVGYDDLINCHHNFATMENHYGENVLVTRKGAVRAGKGDRGIIPGSMGTKSYIVTGLGNPESFNSCSHGAGRKMSRKRARKEFTTKDLVNQTKGVECRKDSGVLDEIPGSYKDIDEVIENQKDLVRVDAELKQILCVKG